MTSCKKLPEKLIINFVWPYNRIDTMNTPSKFLVTRFKLLCVNITVLTGIDVL